MSPRPRTSAGRGPHHWAYSVCGPASSGTDRSSGPAAARPDPPAPGKWEPSLDWRHMDSAAAATYSFQQEFMDIGPAGNLVDARHETACQGASSVANRSRPRIWALGTGHEFSMSAPPRGKEVATSITLIGRPATAACSGTLDRSSPWGELGLEPCCAPCHRPGRHSLFHLHADRARLCPGCPGQPKPRRSAATTGAVSSPS